MADYFTKTCFGFKFLLPETGEFAKTLHDGDEDWGFKIDVRDAENTIYISDEESMDVERAVEFVQAILQHDKSKDVVFFEWANTSSRPLLDGYGGGAVVVSADDAEWIIPAQLRDKAIKMIELRREVAEVMAAREFDEDELEDLVENQKDNLMDGINGGGVESQIEFLLSQDSNIKETFQGLRMRMNGPATSFRSLG